MKNIIVNKLLIVIKNNTLYDDIKLKEIKYGLESCYVTVTKTIVIFTISYILGTLQTLALFMILYGILRLTGFGLHAKKSWQCWVSSGIIFLLIPYICTILNVNLFIKLITSLVCVILIAIYAPADTEKKPIINSKKRKLYKIICVLTAVIYSIILCFINDGYFENILLLSLVLETILILPISYKIFGLKYDNYKDYLKKHHYAAV